MFDYKKYEKPVVLSAMFLVGGYIIWRIYSNTATTDVAPVASTDTVASVSPSIALPALPELGISTAPNLPPLAPINVSNTPQYMTYNYGPTSGTQGTSQYDPTSDAASSSPAGSSCCDDCSDCSTSNGVTQANVVNSISPSDLRSYVANINSPNIGFASPGTQGTGVQSITPADYDDATYEGVLGNGATSSMVYQNPIQGGVQEFEVN